MRIAALVGDAAAAGDAFVVRYLDYLPRRCPLRAGVCQQRVRSAVCAYYARIAGDSAANNCVERAHAWYAETAMLRPGPSGTDFLSPVLIEAERCGVLPPPEFAWLDVPAWMGKREPPTVHARGCRRPPGPLSRSSRRPEFLAWCLRGIASALPVSIHAQQSCATRRCHLEAGAGRIGGRRLHGRTLAATFTTA
jgi:hypothetical protein